MESWCCEHKIQVCPFYPVSGQQLSGVYNLCVTKGNPIVFFLNIHFQRQTFCHNSNIGIHISIATLEMLLIAVTVALINNYHMPLQKKETCKRKYAHGCRMLV